MARVVHRYDPPERFVAGTVGEPGARTFFLQARAGRRITSVSLEKEQVAVLAGRVEEILDQASTRPGAVPLDLETVDNDPLEAPIAEDFRVGTLVLAWQPSTTPGGDRLVVQAYAVDPNAGSDDPDAEPELDAPDELTDQLVVEEVIEAGISDGDELDTADLDPELGDDEDSAISVEEIIDPLAATEENTDALVVRLDRAAARAFARRCATVVAAGRPPCPFCGRPLDPAGHLCPRANGYRPARA